MKYRQFSNSLLLNWLAKQSLLLAAISIVVVFITSEILTPVHAAIIDTPQIVGGEPADEGEWPWQVALIDTSGRDIFHSRFCGGSIIRDQWVLTAAHCFRDNNFDENDVVVLAGIYDVRSPNPGFTEHKIANVFIPSDYYRSETALWSDIALLYLETPIILGGDGASRTAAVRLADESSDNFIGTHAIVTGWGRTNSSDRLIDSYPDLLHEAYAGTVISVDACVESTSGSIKGTQLCTETPSQPSGACLGDSGAPLVYRAADGWIQIGIYSYHTNHCANTEVPTVYTRVSSYRKWIDETMSPYLPETRPEEPSSRYSVELVSGPSDSVYLSPGDSSRVTWELQHTGTGLMGRDYRLTVREGKQWVSPGDVAPDNDEDAVKAPNEVAKFTFDITAPKTPGEYTLKWRMNHRVDGDFGPDLTLKLVVVVQGGEGDGDASNNSDDGNEPQSPLPEGKWNVSFWNNRDLNGDPVRTAIFEPGDSIRVDWPNSPYNGVNAENFSTRFE